MTNLDIFFAQMDIFSGKIDENLILRFVCHFLALKPGGEHVLLAFEKKNEINMNELKLFCILEGIKMIRF